MGTEHISISKIISKPKDQGEFEREINFWVSEGYRIVSRSESTGSFNRPQMYVHLERP